MKNAGTSAGFANTHDRASLMDGSRDIAVVGAGWAGLAAAITLCQAGKRVTVYEAARLAGGRARCAPFGLLTVDNGQHLMLGAYTEMLSLLKQIGMDESRAFIRQPLDLRLADEHGQHRRLHAPRLPSPLNTLIGLLTARGFSWAERFALIKLFRNLARLKWQIDTDISVAQLLAGQPASINRWLWYPMCIAALNTPPAQASAQNFIHILRDSFARARSHTDLLFSRYALGRLFAQPAIEYIEQHGGQVKLSHRIDGLCIADNKLIGIRHADREIPCGQAILATPHYRTHDLLTSHPALHTTTQAMAKIATQPICTVYLQYPAHTKLATPMQGLIGTVSQWVFDRRLCEQPGLMAVVISAEGTHMKLDNASLVELVSDELAHQYPHWPAPEDSLVIREKRATFACSTGIDALRPANRTPVSGLWLAGDYTDTGYPATLEGAVRSGVQCARQLLATMEDN